MESYLSARGHKTAHDEDFVAINTALAASNCYDAKHNEEVNMLIVMVIKFEIARYFKLQCSKKH